MRDLALDFDDELAAHAAGRVMSLGRVGVIDDDLGESVAIAEVQEDQLAVVATSMDPARQPDAGTLVGGAQGATGMGAIGRGEAKVRARVKARVKVKVRAKARVRAKVKVKAKVRAKARVRAKVKARARARTATSRRFSTGSLARSSTIGSTFRRAA